MSERLKHLSGDKEMRIQQLHLLIHNCSVYSIQGEAKKVFIDELNRLEKE